MNYPLISEYVEAIKSPEDNFDKLRHLRPVLDDDGNPYMSGGNFAVVFKMTDGQKEYAIKCFTREQEGREEAYRQIAEELENVSSPFLCSVRYLEKELFVDTKNSAETEFPVLQMEWVEGVTLDKFVHETQHDKYALESLAYNFCRMAQWLLTQSFAHGDLKPDNILVQCDGALVLVDYDGLFVPAMKGEKARELGSPNYRHPQRTEEQFDEHIDDFAIVCIALSLKAIALKPELYDEFGTGDRLLFSDDDFRNLSESKVIGKLQPLMSDADFLRLYGLFLIAYSEQSLANVSFRLLRISKPAKPALVEILSTKATKEELAEAWEDEFGVKYSKDGKKLLEGSRRLGYYSVKPGTKVICDEAFYGCESLQSITIPNLVTSIGNGAFSDCESLQSITIPDSVTSIGDRAFNSCSSLQSITIPDSVTSIGDWAFVSCKSLQSITIPDSVTSIGDGVFVRCDLQIDIDSSQLYSDGYCLMDLSSHRILSCHRCGLVNYSIPDSVTSIGNSAFSWCESLQCINIPNSVTSIGDSAFYFCSSLQSIYIPNSVTSFGSSAFSWCYSLQSVNISNSVTSIGKEAFSYCSSLKSIIIPNSVTSIGDEAFFLCSSLQSINIPNSETSIGTEAFSWCDSLQCINIPNSVTSIGKGAFSSCKSLQSINIPRGTREKFENLLPDEKNILVEIDMLSTEATKEELAEAWEDEFGVKYSKDGKKLLKGNKELRVYSVKPGTKVISDEAFSWCKSLQNISIPNSVTSIGVWAFSRCSSLQSTNIPNSVISIGKSAFSSCKSLQSITIPNSVTSIGNYAFYSCESLQSITIPNSVTSIGEGAFLCCNLQININSSKIYSDGYCLIDLSSHQLLCCHRNDLKNYSIPHSVTNIGNRAFYYCKSLQSINIPHSVTSIGYSAFSCCKSLQSITIPHSVTSIGDEAFYSCESLQSITIPNSVTSIGKSALHECKSLQSITIPNSVTNLGNEAFSWCNSLQSITIPDSVTSIGIFAFLGCSSLQSINIPRGTREKFEKMLPCYKNKLVEIDM